MVGAISGEVGEKALIGPGQFLRQDASFGDDRDEIRVAGPARQDVHMEVVSHAGAGGASEVKPHIVAVGPVLDLEGPFAPLSDVQEFMQFFRPGVAQKRDVAVGRYEYVAGRIGEEIQECERILAAVKDKIILVPVVG